MSSKKFFSWSKNRSPSEPYHRTGGLLTIDTSVGDKGKEPGPAVPSKNTPRNGRRRPPNLNLTIPRGYNGHLNCLTPASARHNAAFVNSATNLLAVVNDMLRSPALSASLCPRSAEIHKPLPSRPRSVSLPSTPDLPVELPGSILLDNQGLPSAPVAGPSTHSSDTMRSVRSGNPISSNAAAKSTPSKVLQHKSSLSESSLKRRSKSRPNLITTPTTQSTESKLTACSASTNGGQTIASNDSTQACVGVERQLQPAPLIVEEKLLKRASGEGSSRRNEANTSTTPTPTSVRSQRIEELKATITAQDSTISTLQAQFGSLRKSHEAEIASLQDAHSAAVASLQDYTRVLEEQQSQRTLHHASSNHFLMLLDTTENPLSPGLQSPTKDSPLTAAGTNSANSIRSFQSALEQQTRQTKDNAEMENLKRKLSAARRPETGNRDMVRELNQYKQNNTALQKQIESLMAKLNESRKNERLLSSTLADIDKNVTQWQEKAKKVEKLEKSTAAMQNSIDHLSHRLELANCDKLDAQEALLNARMRQSPFDPKLPNQHLSNHLPNEPHMSMSTVFSSGSPSSHGNDPHESSTLAAFIAHIERLQEQLKQKDVSLGEADEKYGDLRDQHELLVREHHDLTLHCDIQSKILGKNKQSEIYIDQLRTAIIERESMIGEKDKALRMVERQLEHHKLLLHAEIRRHATMSLFTDTNTEPLPDLTSLASKEDIDRWILRLQARLRKDVSSEGSDNQFSQMNIDDLRKEIDFYVREIIYYKLDIKGYKSDIKKLKNIAQRMGDYGSRTNDVESPTPSLCRCGDTPVRARFPFGVAGLSISNTPSPISTGPISASASTKQPTPTPTETKPLASEPSSGDTLKPTVTTPLQATFDQASIRVAVPQTPTRKTAGNVANEADGIDPGISPRSNPRLSPDRRRPTPTSPGQERSCEMATNFPLSTPAAPKRMDTQRSNSDSIIQMYAAPRTPEWSPAAVSVVPNGEVTDNARIVGTRTRSASVSEATKEKSTPERPPRPKYGLYESPASKGLNNETSTAPRVDVMAEALKNPPAQSRPTLQARFEGKLADLTKEVRGLSSNHLSRSNSTGSNSAIPPPLSLRPRAGSAGSSTAAIGQVASPQRKPSDASGASVPFIIAMPSPYVTNPPLSPSPTPTLPPPTCSITSKSATKPQPSTSRTGVGGTMASSTPLTSPISPPHPDSAKSFFDAADGGSSNTSKIPSPRQAPASHSRNVSLNSIGRKGTPATSAIEGLTTHSHHHHHHHSRNASASSTTSATYSLRNAVQGLPASLIKGKGKARKESISGPTPLASPFDVERGVVGAVGGGGIGEAI
ncbi:hypothetical protein BU24DRAFT_491344 [Aaosphaeria arxii CBS 175.79]|uniref:Uncharacterized protein n=1 Tax=Aaosphaeria arxii CBS 175.79 TaxID=1450172 RepID=A0A6A5XYW3_9PLEO|nr:uncharacterized protein BU24DRAFT_491344 [Aaosphaeria arxii CBS 175.79]KAF2018372.1 hypothetical protein BU24DRAFT_491344 [Aaosphaeria arxii CBS 175.79]